jgi:hypothetical protein
MRKRLTIGLVAATAVFGIVFASAASLGGITAQSLGADDSVVASCDTDGVSTAYVTVYTAAGTAGYKVDSVTVSGINNACDGKAIKVTLTGAADAELETITTTVPSDAGATSMAVDFANSTLAESVAGVHVIISG